MSNKRGKRGRPKRFSVQLNIRDEEQLHRTLDLCGVDGIHPHVNDIMSRVMSRLEDEERERSLALGKMWREQCMNGWPNDMMSYECMGEDVYDPYEEIYDGLACKDSRKLKALNKKLFKRNYKSCYDDVDDYWSNRFSMYRKGEWKDEELDDEENYEESYKSIKFYSDIENELSVREFRSLKEFNDFCSDNNYVIGTTDYSNLINWSVVHCCLDPISEEYGEYEIITDNSYGALYWTVSEDEVKYSNAK